MGTPTLEDIAALCRAFLDESGLNLVADSAALRPDLAGLHLYDHPHLGVAAADDPLFLELLRPEAVGPHFLTPRQWLPEAASVVSIFLPYSRTVTESNRADPVWPSDEWLHARIEGQHMINQLLGRLGDELRRASFLAVSPTLHPGFLVWQTPIFPSPDPAVTANLTSNWSERHVAFVAGQGTFGLSTAFISRHGAAGRLASVVTDLELPATARDYTAHDEYCSHCGACVRRCRIGALSMRGKDKDRCCAFVDGTTREKYRPRYGCGKCYVAVPCERNAPGRGKAKTI